MPKSPLGVVLAMLVTIGALLLGQRAGQDAQHLLPYNDTLNMTLRLAAHGLSAVERGGTTIGGLRV